MWQWLKISKTDIIRSHPVTMDGAIQNATNLEVNLVGPLAPRVSIVEP